MILLTGANGFLGSVIKHSLNGRCLNYITVGRSPEDTLHWDLTMTGPLIPEVDMVVHAAGKAHVVPRTIEEKADFLNVNVKGTQNLLTALENNRSLRKFVFISSVAVYGLAAGTDIQEDAPLLAKDPYGQSKIAAEKLIRDWCIKRNIEYYILRLPLIAGKNAPGNLGAMAKAIRSGRYVSIGMAQAKKSMILASDLASFITGIQGLSGIYNLTDGYHPSFSELERKIATFYKRKKPMSLPAAAAKLLGFAGDIIGSKFPVNSDKIKKITSTLTFSDARAKAKLQWDPREVLKTWEIE